MWFLKSGAKRKTDGFVVLKGSPESLETIVLKTESRSINFPPGALKSFGLNKKTVSSGGSGNATSQKYPINRSPESMYVWIDKGIVMDETIDDL